MRSFNWTSFLYRNVSLVYVFALNLSLALFCASLTAILSTSFCSIISKIQEVVKFNHSILFHQISSREQINTSRKRSNSIKVLIAPCFYSYLLNTIFHLAFPNHLASESTYSFIILSNVGREIFNSCANCFLFIFLLM